MGRSTSTGGALKVVDTPPNDATRRADDATRRAASDGTDGAASDGSAPVPLEPLFTNLVVARYPEPVVSLPNGATDARPVAVVLHGTGDRPDWNCDAWRHITGDGGFVLCPRGAYVPKESTPGDARFTLHGGAPLRAYLEASYAALEERFAAHVDLRQPLAIGFSLGASEIAQLALNEPARYPRVALVEGGHEVWTAEHVRAYAAGGGTRVLFACGSPWCMAPATRAAERLRRDGVEARVVHAPVGHTTDRPLQEAIMAELAWFLGDDPRWAVSAHH